MKNATHKSPVPKMFNRKASGKPIEPALKNPTKWNDDYRRPGPIKTKNTKGII